MRKSVRPEQTTEREEEMIPSALSALMVAKDYVWLRIKNCIERKTMSDRYTCSMCQWTGHECETLKLYYKEYTIASKVCPMCHGDVEKDAPKEEHSEAAK